MDTFTPNNVNLNLVFRNRIAQLHFLFAEKNIDAILVLFSYDCLNNPYMHKLGNWLLFGYSSVIELEDKSLPTEFNETFIIIQRDRLYIYSSHATKEFFYQLTSRINDNIKVELFFTTKEQEGNSEECQTVKVAKFMENTYLLKSVAVPLLYKEKQNFMEIEKWPLICAYGLDCLGEGFFTMKHAVVDIRKDLELLYHKIDMSACINLIYLKAYSLENTLNDFHTFFDREPIERRLERSEDNMNENQELELMRLNYKALKGTTFAFLQDLPDPNVKLGTNSNYVNDLSKSSQPLYKSKLFVYIKKIYTATFDYKFPAFHMIYENMDAVTGIRVGRTLFLYNLQKYYFDYDHENCKYDNIPAQAYDESMFLFNIYFQLVQFIRNNQFDLILGKLDISSAQNNIKKVINAYIESEYHPDNFNFYLNESNILINVNEYLLLDKCKSVKDNKVIVLRVELKDLHSAISRRAIGSVLFCDSFLSCYSDIFNLTHDILPFKTFLCSNTLFNGKETMEYDSWKIIKALSTLKFHDIEYKGLAFYMECYNIPYLFPDSRDLGFDSNQMFFYFQGKLAVFEEYLIFNDASVGNIIIQDKYIEEISVRDEIKYSVMLIKLTDSGCMPLAGVIKNEIIIYLRGNTERLRSAKHDMIMFFKSHYGEIVKEEISPRKFEEYEIVIKTMNENEQENLYHITNSFNLTNALDLLNEMFEYEYILNVMMFQRKKSFISYHEFKMFKNALIHGEEITSQNVAKKKIMILFGGNLSDTFNMSNNIADFGNTVGFKIFQITPPIFLINDKPSLVNYYISQLTSQQDTRMIYLINVYNDFKLINFLSDLLTCYPKLFDECTILNISYALNFNNFIKAKHRDLSEFTRKLCYEDFINFIFIDEGYLKPEKIERNHKIITMANPKANVFNTRSFSKNQKEVKKIFEGNGNGNAPITPGLIHFYEDHYMNTSSEMTSEEVFIKFKYLANLDILNHFLKTCFNVPLKNYYDKHLQKALEQPKVTTDIKKSALMTDQEYQNYLQELVITYKRLQIQPNIDKIFGYCIFSQNGIRKCVSVNANFKEAVITPIETTINENEIGLLFGGRNLESNVDILSQIVLSLSEELPKYKKYRTKNDISEDEIKNLNIVNVERELPPGWYLDGPIYVDENEERHSVHPYLDLFVDEYLHMCNLAIDEHNNKITEELNRLSI